MHDLHYRRQYDDSSHNRAGEMVCLTKSGFPVFLVTYSDIFYFFLWSRIADTLPKEEKYNLFQIYDPIPKIKFA
jgi:hypothetical protein